MKAKTKDILHEAYGKYGIAALNVFNAEQVHGVLAGASDAGVPVIVQLTPAARAYMIPKVLEGMIAAAAEIYGGARFSVHLDHGDASSCVSAIESGFYDSVMIDASREDYERNISVTSEIVKRAHDKGIFVEAELGILGGKEDDIVVDSGRAKYTDPDEAAEFVSRTGCDSLAVAAGTSHGAYKFKGNSGLNLGVLRQIQRLLPVAFPLVLHGASAVPEAEISRINDAGGKLKPEAAGIPRSDILKAVSLGVTKINIATDMRLIWARVHREFFGRSPELFDPILPGKTYMEELRIFVREKCRSLIVAENAD